MASGVNTRNARLLLSGTKAGTYAPINKTHGLNVSMPTDMSDDSGHGQTFKTAVPGLSDYTMSVSAWYLPAQTILEDAAVNKIPYYFLYYPDYADVQNYHRGLLWVGFEGQNSDLGNTTDQSFTMTLADEDIQIVRNGAVL